MPVASTSAIKNVSSDSLKNCIKSSALPAPTILRRLISLLRFIALRGNKVYIIDAGYQHHNYSHNKKHPHNHHTLLLAIQSIQVQFSQRVKQVSKMLVCLYIIVVTMYMHSFFGRQSKVGIGFQHYIASHNYIGPS